MLRRLRRIEIGSKSLIRKIIINRKQLHRKILLKFINLSKKPAKRIYTYIYSKKQYLYRFIHLLKLIFNNKYRRLNNSLKQARLKSGSIDSEEAERAWVDIKTEFSNDTPAEVYVQLAELYMSKGMLDDAKEILLEGVAALNDRGNKLSQATLVEYFQISKQRSEVSLNYRLAGLDSYRQQIEFYKMSKTRRSKDSPKIAIVTAVAGGYDVLRPPAVIDSRFDYIAYADSPVENPGIYDVRPLPYIDADSTRSARFVKTNVHKLLPEYDYVVWIDANILAVGEIYPLVEKFMKSGKDFGAILHPLRRSPFAEMNACIRARKDDVAAIKEQRDYYRSIGYDTDQLIESNILIYNLNSESTRQFLDIWWNQIDRFSRRDQLSINYSLDKAKVDWTTIMEPGLSSRNHPAFALVDHGLDTPRHWQLMRKLGAETVDPLTLTATSSSKQVSSDTIDTVTAIVCVHNALEDVKMCLDSIKRHKADDKFNLIVVDDGSGDDTKTYLEEFVDKESSWAKLVRHDQARGYTVAASVGLQNSDADLSILLNSDTIVTAGWYRKMARAIERTPGAGIVGPMSSAASHQSVPEHRSAETQTAINTLPHDVSVDEMNQYCESWSSKQVYPRVPLVHGFCFGVTRQVIETIGYLDAESFPRGYGEENDYCFRAADAGFGLVIATDTYVYHEKSKSFVGEERIKLMQDGARALRDKHGQRRIDRAVSTMQENPYLRLMRQQAEDLYRTRELIRRNYENVVLTPEGVGSLSVYSYEQLKHSLVQLNGELVDWERAVKSKRQDGPRVSVVVLVLNNTEMTVRCINSILSASSNNSFEVIVVNNGSQLDTTDEIHRLYGDDNRVVLVDINQNVNFALGNNIGFGYARGEYSVFLNNDTYVTNGWLDSLVDQLAGGADIAQPLLLYPDGLIQSAGVVFSARSDLGFALYANQPITKRNNHSRELQAVTGACLAIRSVDYARLHGFDPEYINGQEDIDLCLRLAESKDGQPAKVVLDADSIVYHDESKTPGRGKYRYANREVFLKRWSGKVKSDAEGIFEADGYDVLEWKPESREGLLRDVAIYIPMIN